MHVSLPPYALAPTTFRFAALAALAGRAPLGGAREVVLAVFLAARLADDALAPCAIDDVARDQRAAHAQGWLSSLVLPSSVRVSLAALIDASGGATPAAARDPLRDPSRDPLRHALRAVIDDAHEVLDAPSLAELDALARRFEDRDGVRLASPDP